MNYKVVCEISFPAIGVKEDINLPINKSIEYICRMLDKIIIETISSNYKPKDTSILVNKRTGNVYDKNILLKNTDIGNGTKLTYY